jgi:hypothetical protein
MSVQRLNRISHTAGNQSNADSHPKYDETSRVDIPTSSPSSWYLGLGIDMGQQALAYRTWANERLALDEWEDLRGDPTRQSGPRARRPNQTHAAE